MFILDYHEYPFWKDAKQIVSVLLKANSNAIRFPVIVWGNTYYNSSFLPKYPGLGERDLLEEIVTECRKYGIKVIPYNHLGGVIHREVYRLHPEWSVRKPDGPPNAGISTIYATLTTQATEVHTKHRFERSLKTTMSTRCTSTAPTSIHSASANTARDCSMRGTASSCQ